MTTVSYKDYQGSVAYEDGRLLIQLLHVDDFVSTECESASEVASVFAEMVEDYIETCRTIGKEPSKPFKGSFNVRVPQAIHRAAALDAARLGKTLNAWVCEAMEAKLSTPLKRPISAAWFDFTAMHIADRFAAFDVVREAKESDAWPRQAREIRGISVEAYAGVVPARDRGKSN